MEKSFTIITALLLMSCTSQDSPIHLKRSYALEDCINWVSEQPDSSKLECREEQEGSRFVAIEAMPGTGTRMSSQAGEILLEHKTFRYEGD